MSFDIDENFEFYGEEAIQVRQAYEDSLTEVADRLDVELDFSDYGCLNVCTGDYDLDSEVNIRVSNTEVYREEMLENFDIVEGFSVLVKEEDYPVHEIAESAGHMVGEVSVGGRKKEKLSDVLINELFGSYGLAMEDRALLENDKEILARNLELQEEFFGEEQQDFIIDNIDKYQALALDLAEKVQDLDDKELIEEISLVRENLLEECPAKLEDYENYSFSKKYDLGTYSEALIESYITPPKILQGNGNIENQEISNKMKETANYFDNLTETDVRKMADCFHQRASENNRAYLIAREIAERSLENRTLSPDRVAKLDNSEIRRRLSEEISHIDQQLVNKYNVPIFDTEDGLSKYSGETISARL